MAEPVRTVAGPGEARFEVNGSTFVGLAGAARTVAEAEAFVEEVNAEYPDARHVVPAYRVPADEGRSGADEAMLREWCSDDGEPSGSSGKPALNVLVQQEIRNVVVAVVRYKSGPNLGVGGLARAYSRAVKEAVEDAGVVEKLPRERFAAAVEYGDSGTVRAVLESEDVEFDADYAEDVRFEIRVPVDEASALRDRLQSATSGRVDLS
ncbi:IMPACT family protein [Salinirarus marinus]|uniref:IMPACT family protein n=1 Tax=Salinirarus marinus TaxID=3068310 RepID=UPI003C6C873E